MKDILKTKKNFVIFINFLAQEWLAAIERCRNGKQREDIPQVQGQEQRLHFAGAAVKGYPKSKVRETQVSR